MANSITYAGLSIFGILDDPILRTHIEKFFSDLEVETITPQRSFPGARLLGISKPLHNVKRPRLSFNSLYYPVTASDWAEIHLLVNVTGYKQLLNVAFSSALGSWGNPIPNTLTLTQQNTTISTPMFMLDAHPLSAMDASVYHITLVDERYYFQFAPVILTLTDLATWDDAFTSIASQLLITLTTDTIPAAYLQPAVDSDLQANNENGGLILDACASSCGLRIVRNLDGTYNAQSATNATTQTQTNNVGVLMAGGDSITATDIPASSGPAFTLTTSNAILPRHVQMSFPKWCDSVGYIDSIPQAHLPYPRTYGDEYILFVNLDSCTGYTGLGFFGFDGAKIYQNTCKAIFAHPTDGTPTNSLALGALVQQAAQDYYDWTNDGLDVTFPLIAWEVVEGKHNVIWNWEEGTTRVSHLPWNYGFESLCNYTPVTCPLTTDLDVETKDPVTGLPIEQFNNVANLAFNSQLFKLSSPTGTCNEVYVDLTVASGSIATILPAAACGTCLSGACAASSMALIGYPYNAPSGKMGHWGFEQSAPGPYTDDTGLMGNLTKSLPAGCWNNLNTEDDTTISAIPGIIGNALQIDGRCPGGDTGTGSIAPGFITGGTSVPLSSFATSLWVNVIRNSTPLGGFAFFWQWAGFDAPSVVVGNDGATTNTALCTIWFNPFTPSTLTFPPNTWNHIVFSFDANSIDGSHPTGILNVWLNTVNQTLSVNSGVSSPILNEFASVSNCTHSIFANAGAIVAFDEFAVFGNALTQCEVDWLYNGGTPQPYPWQCVQTLPCAPSGSIFIGQPTGSPTAQPVTGGGTISYTGALTIPSSGIGAPSPSIGGPGSTYIDVTDTSDLKFWYKT